MPGTFVYLVITKTFNRQMAPCLRWSPVLLLHWMGGTISLTNAARFYITFPNTQINQCPLLPTEMLVGLN